MSKKSYFGLNQKIILLATGIFAVSGILPWIVVNFPIGNLKISVLDLMIYFSDPNRATVDFYSNFIYGILLTGWIFTILFLATITIIPKKKLVLVGSIITTIPAIIWLFAVPSLRIQMIFLSLSNQPIDANQTMGSGEVAVLVSGILLIYSFFITQRKS